MGIKIEYLEEEIPVYDITVKDNHNFYANNILVHNCVEITLPTTAPTYKEDHLEKDLSTEKITLKEYSDPGKIALCNLSSINLIKWIELSDIERDEVSYNLLRASDNLLEYAYYPAKEGEIFNRNFRAIGVGVTNLAQLFALKNLKFGEEETLQYQNDIMESIYWHLMRASIKLAEERGRFEEFKNTKYAQGKFSFDLYTGPYNYDLNYDWDSLRKRMLSSGTRFGTLLAVAPTATSGSTIRSTEGIEPVRKLVTVKTGNYSCKQLVPNLNKLRSGYEIAWDINPEKLIKTASVRQRWICQSQSFSTYNKDRHESAFEILKDVILAEKYGLKSLYYAHTPKDDDVEEGCESCSVG